MRHKPKQQRAIPLIIISGLRHSYNGALALNGVSLEVSQGEILGILGPNGGGKSTLFRILSTSLIPSEGDALIGGESISKSPGLVREKIGVVFQSFGLDRKLTVRENLRHQGNLYAMQGGILEERIDVVLESFDLADRSDHRVETLSGGLQRRVEIAKGVLHKPKVLLLDEPSTGLDPSARLDLWRFLEHCRTDEQTTIVFTTHLAEEAERCDRIAILDKGLLVASGTPGDLKEAIGGDVVLVQSRNTLQLKTKIQRQFKIQATVLGSELLIEVVNGHSFIPRLVRAFPGLVTSVTLRKPTLEDVFIHTTGHRLHRNGKDGSAS
jgi:ABC-2 type transport system ATP-binding protein